MRAAPLLLLALLPTRAAAGPVEAPDAAEGALSFDDECSLHDGACALEALQRRAGPQQSPQSPRPQEPEALPGEPPALAELAGNRSARWGYCAYYGCHGYRRGQACQCNNGCSRHGNCCVDYQFRCHAPAPAPAPPQGPQGHASSAGVMSLYHQTSPEACKAILQGGFHIGRGGWCGKGIYFAVSPEDTKTKAITPHSGVGCMLEAKVNVGRVLRYPCCRYCGGRQNHHINHNEQELAAQGYDSIQFNPGDGDEYIVYSSSKVLSIRSIPFKEQWRAHIQHW